MDRKFGALLGYTTFFAGRAGRPPKNLGGENHEKN